MKSSIQLYFPAVVVAIADTMPKTHQIACAQGQRVLYVDDEEDLIYLMKRILKRLGYEVIGYTDPVAALQEFRSRPGDFGVVVSDLSMPNMSGFDLAREVLAIRPEIPILLTSGYVRLEDKQEAQRLGIRDLIPKLNTYEELGKRLDSLFREIQIPVQGHLGSE